MYVKIINQSVVQYPYSLYTLRLENPRTSFPDNIETDHDSLMQYGVYRVFPTILPVVDTQTQKLVESVPKYIEDRWTQAWEVVELSEAELFTASETQAANIRNERNRLLAASDWTQVADAPVDRAAWAEYRQQLRNISAQQDFPYNIEWPTQPVNTAS